MEVDKKRMKDLYFSILQLILYEHWNKQTCEHPLKIVMLF